VSCYDSRKGVGPCDHEPSGLGREGGVGKKRPVSRAAEKAG
jgi:hypothetical protein